MVQIERLQLGDVTVLRIEGDLDEDGVPELRMALVNCLRDGSHNLVVNLEGMRFISYMGVGVLVERLRQFRSENGDMKLVGLNLYTQRLFRMSGITRLFQAFDNEAQAVEVYQEAA